jgi:hypothetical protein
VVVAQDMWWWLRRICGGGCAGYDYVVVVAQDMWWGLCRICGGGGAGYVVGEIKNKANSAQLELELPKNCHYLAKFSPKCIMQKYVMPTISKKLHQWLKHYVTIQSLALWNQNGPKGNF